MKITVSICAYNEAKNIGNLLKNLLNQPFLENQELIEIIVVCGGCTDGTENIVQSFCDKDKRIKLINHLSRQGKTSAQNVVLGNAKGDVIVSISADTYPTKKSVSVLANAIRNDVAGANSKVVIVNKHKGLANFISHFIWSLHDQTLLCENERKTLTHLGGDMFAIKNGLITQIPPNVINDDAYLGIMITAKGYRIRFIPQAKYYSVGPSNIVDYLSQRRRIIYGHKQLQKLVNQSSTVIKTISLRHPLYALSIFFNEIKKLRPQDLFKIFPMLMLEGIASLLALWDSYQKNDKKHVLWDRINSTKVTIKNKDAIR